MIKYLSENNLLFKFGAVAVTIYPHIYLSAKMRDLDPVKRQALLVHELRHLQQQKQAGKIWFLKYVFSKKFRLSQELEAYKAEYDCLKNLFSFTEVSWLLQAQVSWLLQAQIAQSLSSETYFKMISYDDAFEIVKKW